MKPTQRLVVCFRGWFMLRQATDPDPPDERWGASGYTFAFAGEPAFDRVLRLQPNDHPGLIRLSEARQWGVFVFNAFVGSDGRAHAATRPLLGARVVLRGAPKFETRGWLLTPPGWEPIYPFHLALEAEKGKNLLQRTAPLDVDYPTRPVWKQPVKNLLAQGGKDIWLERETVGNATGIWDAVIGFRHRMEFLRVARAKTTSKLKIQCIDSRLHELDFAVKNPLDRRVMVRYCVERFGFRIEGTDGWAAPALDVLLDVQQPWQVDFWMGAWDFDLLGGYMQGSLQIPLKQG